MRPLLYLLLAVCLAGRPAVAQTPAPPAAGILILKAVAGYPAAAISFVSIRWVDTNGGYAIDSAGTKTPFLNDGIGRVIYFDQAYYEEIDHNQYWLDWRAGIQSREIVIPPVDAVSLGPEDVPHLQAVQATLEDIVQRFGTGQDVVAPIVARIQDDTTKLNSGLVLQNGKWIPAKDATAPEAVPVIGDTEHLVTFTTRDGRKFQNARVSVTETGLSVLTSDGGASVSFDRLPADLSPFPAAARSQIRAGQAKLKVTAGQAVEAAPPEASAPPAPVVGFWANVELFFQNLWHRIWSLFVTTPPAASATAPPPPSS